MDTNKGKSFSRCKENMRLDTNKLLFYFSTVHSIYYYIYFTARNEDESGGNVKHTPFSINLILPKLIC